MQHGDHWCILVELYRHVLPGAQLSRVASERGASGAIRNTGHATADCSTVRLLEMTSSAAAALNVPEAIRLPKTSCVQSSAAAGVQERRREHSNFIAAART
jgi:hypothetical protein